MTQKEANRRQERQADIQSHLDLLKRQIENLKVGKMEAEHSISQIEKHTAALARYSPGPKPKSLRNTTDEKIHFQVQLLKMLLRLDGQSVSPAGVLCIMAALIDQYRQLCLRGLFFDTEDLYRLREILGKSAFKTDFEALLKEEYTRNTLEMSLEPQSAVDGDVPLTPEKILPETASNMLNDMIAGPIGGTALSWKNESVKRKQRQGPAEESAAWISLQGNLAPRVDATGKKPKSGKAKRNAGGPGGLPIASKPAILNAAISACEKIHRIYATCRHLKTSDDMKGLYLYISSFSSVGPFRPPSTIISLQRIFRKVLRRQGFVPFRCWPNDMASHPWEYGWTDEALFPLPTERKMNEEDVAWIVEQRGDYRWSKQELAKRLMEAGCSSATAYRLINSATERKLIVKYADKETDSVEKKKKNMVKSEAPRRSRPKRTKAG